jgi:general secretion pathway protein A
MASALYGVSTGRGFTAIVAYPGMGKTTLLFDFLSKIKNYARTVFLFQPQSDARDLIRCLLADIEIEDDGKDLVRMHRKLNDFLLGEARRGRKLVVVLDEAQTLDEEVLEAVRMLSNFETPREKLIHLVLAGQPQLADKLASPGLLQLRQRISMISHLHPFNVEETQKYIEHRLRVAGYSLNVPMFSSAAIRIITKYTQGIPRNINNVCFNAMSIAFVAKQRTIDERIILEVIDDLDLKIRTNAPAAVSSEREFKAEHENGSFGAAGHPMLKIQPSNELMSSPGVGEHKAPTDRNEWIVEFSPSDLDSLNPSKQQTCERAVGSPLSPALKSEKSSPQGEGSSLSAASIPPPRVAVAAAGSMGSMTVTNDDNVGNVARSGVNTSNPAPPSRRVVGGARKHPPRKISNWRALGPQVVLVILLFVTLGWLATQARRRGEAHLAPKVPVGILIIPATGATRAVLHHIETELDESTLEFLVRHPNTSDCGAIS